MPLVALALLVLTGTLSEGSNPSLAPAPQWTANVQAAAARTEYEAAPVADSARKLLQAPNRSQGFRTLFEPGGVRVRPREADQGSWELGLSLSGVGAPRAVAPVRPAANGNRVEYRREGFTEWYVNDERGLEQGFTFAAPPREMGSGHSLRLELSVSGDLSSRPVDEGVVFEHSGEVVLSYAGLRSWDARGRELPSRIELDPVAENGTALRLVVDVREAEYPVTVDPLVTSPAWTEDGEQLDGQFAGFVAVADVNGDGYGDVIVGAPYFDTGMPDTGRAFVYHGSPTGPSSSPSWTYDGTLPGDAFGVVARAGDVNGDGYDDVVVGAPGVTSDQLAEGQAFVFLGGPSGLASTPTWSAEGNQDFAALGLEVASAGDVNGDGYDDVIVAAPLWDEGMDPDVGRVLVYYGSSSGPGSTPWTVIGDQASAQLGLGVTGGGDFNADGYADIALGAPLYDQGATNNGRVFVYHGSSSGLPGTPTRTLAQPSATYRDGALFGRSLSAAGDADGDGYGDLLVGEPVLSDGSNVVGRASLFAGGASGLGSTPVWTATGAVGSYYGLPVAFAGDLDGDGYADWMVGAAYYNATTSAGRVYVYHGQASLGSVTGTTLSAGQAGDRFGGGLAAGDVNGDGFADALVGAYLYDDTQSDEGRAFLYLGTPGTGVDTSYVWHYESNIYGRQFGTGVAHAGDVNGDGYPDVIVGVPEARRVYAFYGTATGMPASPSWSYLSTGSDYTIGISVDSAGDVNGDGYSDVIVGNHGWQSYGGRAVIFLGSASGLSSAPDWQVTAGGTYVWFGISVAGAGDVNGDGYADVLVGGSRYTYNSQPNAGMVRLYLGSPDGPSTSWAWIGGGEQADELCGSVAGVGDVNGDGYADFAVGSPGWSNGETSEGRVRLYLGGPSGPASTPSWTVEGNVASAFFSLPAPAGDVNGDGFADMLVASTGSISGNAVFVFHGSSTGPSTTAALGWDPPSRVSAVDAAGDVNGDGYGDILVGRSTGQDADVLFGSPAGVTSVGLVSFTETAYGGSAFGRTVSTAGDVDGDGRAEIIVGAPEWEDDYPDQAMEGAVFLYSMPPGRAGRSLTLRGGGQTAIVPPEGRAYDSDDFQVRQVSVSPYGRVRGKVEVEACAAGVAWGSGGCTGVTSGSWFELNGASGVTDTVTVPGLDPRTLYRWRARTLYARSSVTQPGITEPANPRHGPWRRMQAQQLGGDVRVDQGITVHMESAAVSISETNLQVAFGVTMETADGQPNLYPVSVPFGTADGTATAGSDYTATTGDFTWHAGFGSVVTNYGTIALAGGDGVSEGPETFFIQLGTPVSAALVAPTEEVVTIVDSDPREMSIGDASVLEGDSGTVVMVFPVTLNYSDTAPASAHWTTVSGSASGGSDFQSASGTVSFAASQTSQTIEVLVNGDTLDEGDETFEVVLSDPSGAWLGDTTGVGTIENDDGPAGSAVAVFVATAQNGRADLEWVYPGSEDTVRIRYTEGTTCTAPSDPETGGTLLGDYTGTAGEPDLAPHTSLTNGQQYCYGIWTVQGGSTYVAGPTTHARPMDNSPGQPAEPILWAYTTGATSVAAPGLGEDTVLAVSNDSLVHAMARGSGAGAGLWPAGYRPRVLGGAAEERPAVIGLPVVAGAESFTLLGGADGQVYAVDAVEGGVKWSQALLPSGTAITAAPSAFFAEYGAPWGIDFDVVVVGTHATGGGNRLYALDAETGAVVGTPYAGGIGWVSGAASLDYPTSRAYFASRTDVSPNSLWCFDVSAGGLSLGWAISAGEMDASPVLRGGAVYTSTIDGDVMAYSAADGTPLWWDGAEDPFPTEAGGVKAFIYPDRLSDRLYFSTLSRVWALNDDGASASEVWSTTAVPSPSTAVEVELGGVEYVFVGGGDGKLYQLDAATGTQVRSVQLGGASEAIGSPTVDNVSSLVYVGSEAGIIYGVKVPLP